MSFSGEIMKEPILFTSSSISKVLNVYCAKGLNIPIYQRLYAWSEKEIVKLLDDIYSNYKPDNQQNMSTEYFICLLYTSPSPRDRQKSRMPSSA